MRIVDIDPEARLAMAQAQIDMLESELAEERKRSAAWENLFAEYAEDVGVAVDDLREIYGSMRTLHLRREPQAVNRMVPREILGRGWAFLDVFVAYMKQRFTSSEPRRASLFRGSDTEWGGREDA